MLLNLYWSLLIIAFGLCVGSFLNVVIFRWPRDLSIRRPLWSFCPTCQSTLRWRDNLPVLSYVLLRGRCRYCRTRISLQYPLVELATAFAFLLIYDALFVAKLRHGIADVSADWPMLLAHWVLAAGLIVVTVMDLEAYIVDIRVTWIMTALGFLLHAIWTPASSTTGESWIRPGGGLAAIAGAAGLGLIIAAVLWLRHQPESADAASVDTEPSPSPPPAEAAAGTHAGGHVEALSTDASIQADGQPDGAEASAGCSSTGETPVPHQTPPPHQMPSPKQTAVPQPVGADGVRGGVFWVWAVLGLAVVGVYVAAIVWHDYQEWSRIMEPPRDANGRLVWPEPPRVEPGMIRTGVGLVVLFAALTLFASHPHPEEDQEIVEAIDAEAADSRGNALRELGLLTPALLLMAIVGFLLAGESGFADRLDRVVHWKAVGQWQPMWGLATALVGWFVGGALAWLTRILGTLGLGKEAFGMGDVHIMAAIGAIAGGAVAFVGFFAASVLALLGMLVILFRRQGRALPYGPWLALASFIVVVYQDRILAYLQIR